MRAPGFWFAPPERPGVLARLLAPLAALRAHAQARRLAGGPEWHPPVPVICLGALAAGGTGRSAAVMALAQMLQALGAMPHVLVRGEGGRLAGPVRVVERTHGAADVGDEALLLASFAPVWVGRDTVAAARAAVADGAGVLVLADGLHDPALPRSLALGVVDARLGFGNGRCRPAGPLHAPVVESLARGDLLVCIGSPGARARFLAGRDLRGVAVAEASLQPLAMGMRWEGLRALAFAGIARPEAFFASLRAAGVRLLRAEALSDHQPLTDALMARLEFEARALGAQLVTTEKDAVRLPTRFRAQVLAFPVRLAFEAPEQVRARLRAVLSG